MDMYSLRGTPTKTNFGKIISHTYLTVSLVGVVVK